MAVQCIRGLKEGFTFDCEYIPIKGIYNRVVLINFEDIDRRKVMREGVNLINFSLKEGKRGYSIEGYKRHFTGRQKYSSNKYTHELDLRVYDFSNKHISLIEDLHKGTFVAVIQSNEHSFEKSGFEVLGYDAGLRVVSLTRDYKENMIRFTLGSDKVKEPRIFYYLHDIDWATTKKQFDKEFVTDNSFKVFDETFDETFE